MKLLTHAQRAKFLTNGGRQAAVRSTDAELDPWRRQAIRPMQRPARRS